MIFSDLGGGTARKRRHEIYPATSKTIATEPKIAVIRQRLLPTRLARPGNACLAAGSALVSSHRGPTASDTSPANVSMY